MVKVETSKSKSKINDNEHSFVKNRGGFHPESTEKMQDYMRPGKPDLDGKEFRIAKGDQPSGREPTTAEDSDGLIEKLYTVLRNPVATIRKFMEKPGA